MSRTVEWSELNAKYVLHARRMLLGGRGAQGEELLRQGLEETGDAWLAYHLAEAIVTLAPEDASRLEEACAFYDQAVKRLAGTLHRQLAEAARDKARVLLEMAPKRSAGPKSLLPTADVAPVRRPVARPVDDEAPPDPMLAKLKESFGFESFRAGQREVIEILLKGRHALSVMQPGSGRSLVYELSARLLEGATVVVTSRTPRDGSRAKYVTPDRLGEEFGAVSLLVVENAETASEWSPRFRSEMAGLRDAIRRISPGAILASAGTANQNVRNDIIERLGLSSPYVHVGTFDRRNLVWSVIETRDKLAALKIVLAEQGGPAVVYVGRRSDADSLAGTIPGASAVVEEWEAGKARVLVTARGETPALSRKDVRAVVHWQMPMAIETYYEEATHAGRDGQAAQCVLLYDPDDRGALHRVIELAYPDRPMLLSIVEAIEERRDPYASGTRPQVMTALAVLEQQGFLVRDGDGFIRRDGGPNLTRIDMSDVERSRRRSEDRLRAMERYTDARGCRRLEILGYFGERLAAGYQCAGCDRCRAARETAGGDGAVVRQAVIVGVKELESRRFSINEMARAMLFLAPAHVTRPLKGKSEAEVRDFINALLREGAIELDPSGRFVRARR